MQRTAPIALLAVLAPLSSAQLVTACTGDEPGARSWFIDVETGEFEGGVLGGYEALAVTPSANRIFASSGNNLVEFVVDAAGDATLVETRLAVDSEGETLSGIDSMAWGNGELYAFHSGLGDAPGGLYVFDIGTTIETPTFDQVPAVRIIPVGDLPLPEPIDFVAETSVQGLTFDTDRGELLIGVEKYDGPSDEPENLIGNDIFLLDPQTAAAQRILETPFSLGEGGFDGLAYSRDRIYLDCGAPCGDISV